MLFSKGCEGDYQKIGAQSGPKNFQFRVASCHFRTLTVDQSVWRNLAFLGSETAQII